MNRIALTSIGLWLAACCPTPHRASAPTPLAPPTPPMEPTPPAAAMGLDWSASGVDWSKPPPAWEETPFVPPTPVHFTLANGINVYLVENHRLPLVSVRVIQHAAGTRQDGAQPGLAGLTADLLDEGAGTWSALELTEELERLGMTLEVGASTDGATLVVDGLSETIDGALGVAADVLMRPRFSDADFNRVKTEQLDDLALRVDTPRAIAAVVFQQVAFGAHPYGAPATGWIETVGKFKLTDVKAFWKTHYGPSVTSIVVTGDVTRAALEPMLQRRFGRWKARVKAALPPQAAVAGKPLLAVVDMPGRPQTVVSIGRLGPSSDDPARAALDVVNTALGGSFASRLNARLREELGYTYGIMSRFARGQWAGAWAVSSSIRTDVTGAAIREALAIIAATAATPLPAEELAKAKALITRSMPEEFETNAAISAAFASLIADARPLTFWNDRISAINAVTAAAAQTASAAWWNNLSIVVVGDWAAIGKDLESLGLPIVRYHVDGRQQP